MTSSTECSPRRACAPTRTFSATVRPRKSSTFWKVRAIPRRTTAFGRVRRRVSPSKRTSLESTDEAAGPFLVLCAGDRRVDTDALGGSIRSATADEVRAGTGFAIGGVPPLGHDRPLRTVVDESLLRFDTVWCAGGTPRTVFPVATRDLIAAIPEADVRAVG